MAPKNTGNVEDFENDTAEGKAGQTGNVEDFFDDVALPEKGQKVVGDVDAYWDIERSAIRFKPMSVKLFDGNIDKKKPSILILGITTVPTMLYNKTDEEDSDEREYKKYPAGTKVGVWYKPGMKQIRDRCGVDCYLKMTGEKDTGKPNPMKLFELVADSETYRIPIIEDSRDKSKGEKTDFDPVRRGKPSKDEDDESNDVDDGPAPF